MDFKVIFTEPFVKDLQRIIELIAPHNPDAALQLGEIIIKTAESLSFFPERFPKVRQRPEVRRFIAKKYFKVFYRVQPSLKTVEILRCWDARQESDPSLT